MNFLHLYIAAANLASIRAAMGVAILTVDGVTTVHFIAASVYAAKLFRGIFHAIAGTLVARGRASIARWAHKIGIVQQGH